MKSLWSSFFFFVFEGLLQWTEPFLFLPKLFTDNYSLNKPQWLLCQAIRCAARKHQFVAIALGELSRVQWRLGLSPRIETWQWDIKCSQIKSSSKGNNKRLKQAGLLLKHVRVDFFSHWHYYSAALHVMCRYNQRSFLSSYLIKSACMNVICPWCWPNHIFLLL